MNKSSGMDLRCEKAGVAGMDVTDDCVIRQMDWIRHSESERASVIGLQSEIHRLGFGPFLDYLFINTAIHHTSFPALQRLLILNLTRYWCDGFFFPNCSCRYPRSGRFNPQMHCDRWLSHGLQRTLIELKLLCGLHHILYLVSLNPFDFWPPPRFTTTALDRVLRKSHYCSLWLKPGGQVI